MTMIIIKAKFILQNYLYIEIKTLFILPTFLLSATLVICTKIKKPEIKVKLQNIVTKIYILSFQGLINSFD